MTEDVRSPQSGQRTETGEVTCDKCGVVQETTFSEPDEFPNVAGVRNPKTADGECAVCETPLTGKKGALGP